MMVTMGAPSVTTSPCRAAHTSTLPLMGADDLRVAFLHPCLLLPARGHWLRRRGSGPRCAPKRRSAVHGPAPGADWPAPRPDCRRAASTAAFAACSAVTISSRACVLVNSLLRQGHGAAGIGLLVLILRLSLRQSGLRRLHLRLGAHRCAGGFAAVLLLCVLGARSASNAGWPQWPRRPSAPPADPGSQSPRSARPAFTSWPSSTVSVWMRPGILELTMTSFASTVPISCRSLERRVVARYQISDPTSQQSQNHENSISCAHSLITSNDRFLLEFGGLRHGRIGQHLGRQFRAVLPILKERLAKKLHG